MVDFLQNGIGNLTSTIGERQSKRNALEKCRLLIVQGTYLPLHTAAVYVRGLPVLGILADRRSAHAQQISQASMSSQRAVSLQP